VSDQLSQPYKTTGKIIVASTADIYLNIPNLPSHQSSTFRTGTKAKLRHTYHPIWHRQIHTARCLWNNKHAHNNTVYVKSSNKFS
jgi:hypothetical protein